MTLNIIFVLIILTHAQGFESIKKYGGQGPLAAPYCTLHYQKSFTLIIMTSITWADPSCVQELGTFLSPQNRTQGRCEVGRRLFLKNPPIFIAGWI